MNQDLFEDLLESHGEMKQVPVITKREKISIFLSNHYGKIICLVVGAFLFLALFVAAYFTYWYN